MISMKEIAAEAGVSRTTVSFVLSGRYKRDVKLSPGVVKKVKTAAARMGYVRNELVQSVVKGKSKVIAILAKFADYMMPMIRGCSDEAAKYGYSISLIPCGGENTLNQALMKAVEYRVGGIIVMNTEQEEKAGVDPDFFKYGIPVNGLGPEGAHTFDQTLSAEVMADYLVSLGHRKILFFGTFSSVSERRFRGYRNVMEKNRLPVNRIHAPDFSAVVSAEPDAVFCYCDPLALRLLHYLYLRRIFVPEAFSVAGFGDVNSNYSAPALTTISEPYYENGRIGFQRLYHMILTGESPKNDPLIGKLIVRESTVQNHKYGRDAE